MVKKTSWTRRGVMKATVGAAALGSMGLNRALATPAVIRGTQLTYWVGRIFSDTANQMIVDEINKWGADNGVETNVVVQNSNQMVQTVSAAIAANTMPDALDADLSMLLVLSSRGQFMPLDDLYQSIGGGQGGWLDPVAAAADTTGVSEGQTGIPYGTTGNMLLRRTDVLAPAGFDEPPATWADMVEQAKQVASPPLFGLGFALSNIPDSGVQTAVLHSYGGRIADDEGKNPAIKSDETRAYLDWVKGAWDAGLFPPGVTTWDGGGDNQSYLGGQSVFIGNTGSVGINARQNDPELFEATGFSSLPAGPIGTISPISLWLRSVPASSQNPEAAKDLIAHLSQPEFLLQYYSNAIFGPVMSDQLGSSIYDGDRIQSGLRDLVQNGTSPSYPDVFNPPFAEMRNNFVVAKMVQRVVIDDWDFDRAMDEAQTVLQSIYSKY